MRVGVQPQFAQRGQSSDCGRFIGDETEARITCSYRSSPGPADGRFERAVEHLYVGASFLFSCMLRLLPGEERQGRLLLQPSPWSACCPRKTRVMTPAFDYF